MNLSTFIVLIILVVLITFASIYLYRHGTCGACPDAPSCSGHCSSRMLKKKMKEDPLYKEKNMQIDNIMKKHGM
jgi:radical SAM protein with 4Fe4S-binding SPASM domain